MISTQMLLSTSSVIPTTNPIGRPSGLSILMNLPFCKLTPCDLCRPTAGPHDL